jgi:hypothetical protein
MTIWAHINVVEKNNDRLRSADKSATQMTKWTLLQRIGAGRINTYGI